MRIDASYLFYSSVQPEYVDMFKMDITVSTSPRLVMPPCIDTRLSGTKRSAKDVWLGSSPFHDCPNELFREFHKFYDQEGVFGEEREGAGGGPGGDEVSGREGQSS